MERLVSIFDGIRTATVQFLSSILNVAPNSIVKKSNYYYKGIAFFLLLFLVTRYSSVTSFKLRWQHSRFT